MSLVLNGRSAFLAAEPRTTLLEALREGCGLTGAAACCEDGSCGSCTVLFDGEPLRACTLFALQAHGADIVTVEGLADGESLSAVQRAFVETDPFPCGACAAGFVVLTAGALALDPDMDEAAIAELTAANVCRCGAYGAIRAAIRAAQAKLRTAG